MEIIFQHFIIMELGTRSSRAGFGDLSLHPTFLEKGQALLERKVLLCLLNVVKNFEDTRRSSQLHFSLSGNYIDPKFEGLVRRESQKVSGYSYQLSLEYSLDFIDTQLNYNDAHSFFNTLFLTGKLLVKPSDSPFKKIN